MCMWTEYLWTSTDLGLESQFDIFEYVENQIVNAYVISVLVSQPPLFRWLLTRFCNLAAKMRLVRSAPDV